ncbi:GAP family protein [Luteimonas suaedae]|uniref:GAP family protein n=1 Tax=Luteimonas suaedae TaxID=2605430 RepID=UPI0016591696|nr:GAP family protein [Luteimonas suaedae]
MDNLLPILLPLALLDSLNPSALVVALWLLSQPRAAPRLLAYVAGILVAYLGLGIAMMLGITAARDTLAAVLDHPVAVALQALLGAGLLVYAIFAPSGAHQAHEPHAPASGRLAAFALLGMTVTVVELVTALPYFAAIALMIAAELSPAQWLPLLVGYNLVFVAPPLLLLGLHALLGHRTDERFARWRERLRRGAREATLWIFGIVGVALLGDAAGRWIKAGKERDDAVAIHAPVAPAQGNAARPAADRSEPRTT